jgi:hypothetical protein
MEFNPDKCEVITITNKRSHINYPYNIHGKELVHVQHAKYLGKQLATNSLTFDEVFFVISLMKIRKGSGPNTVPWGTSDVTSDLEECFPSSTTSCF